MRVAVDTVAAVEGSVAPAAGPVEAGIVAADLVEVGAVADTVAAAGCSVVVAAAGTVAGVLAVPGDPADPADPAVPAVPAEVHSLAVGAEEGPHSHKPVGLREAVR
jgi:hypothetical protein